LRLLHERLRSAERAGVVADGEFRQHHLVQRVGLASRHFAPAAE